ncbi:hypothetical protein [Streptomyces sp. NPDC012508]|uniref:hypothetical protein n=1 Tax=Streptomyces sp. NPDC012508 TaxID=3364837 RepID=UPI00368B8AB4
MFQKECSSTPFRAAFSLSSAASRNGDRFMSLAKKQRPAEGLYERHGFIVVERTGGLRNDEREPDVRYLWQPPPAR